MTSFEQLYNTYFKRVYAYTLLRVRNPALAEDLCAAAWRKAYRHLETYDEQKGSFTQWIFTIARNEINMYRRLYWVKHLFSLTDAEEYLPSAEKSPAEQLEEQLLKRTVLDAVKKLSARERDLISLKFYAGLNNRQIAGMTGLSESNVGTLLSRAARKLRKRLETL